MSRGLSRRQEREQVAAVARRRMELLEAELAGMHQRSGPPVGDETRWASRDEVGPAEHDALGASQSPREPGAHRQARSAGPARPPLRAGRPAGLGEPADEEPEPTWRSRPSEPGVPPWGASTPARPRGRDERLDPLDLLDTGTDAEPGGLAGWCADRLPATLQGRVALSGRTALALVAGAALVLAVVCWTVLRGGGGEAVPQAQVRTVAGSPLAAVSSADPSPGASSPAAPVAAGGSPGATPAADGQVVVDVAGKVRHPGIVTLPAGSRVHEAIQRAGGPRPGVSLTSINLARPLVDGEQILVGVKGAPVGAAPATGGGSGSSDGSSSAGGLVNINTADASALDTLPGVGEVTAQKILDYRTSHGGFTSVDDLLDVDGIGDKTLADIKPHVTV